MASVLAERASHCSDNYVFAGKNSLQEPAKVLPQIWISEVQRAIEIPSNQQFLGMA